MKKFEVTVSQTWISSKSIHFELEAEDEESARDEAISESRSSHNDDWSGIVTNNFEEQVEEIEEIKDGS